MTADVRRTALRLLASTLRGRPRAVGELLLWTTVEAVPALAWGRLVARAVDRGFLAHRPGVGFLYLALLGATVALGVWGARQTYVRVTALVEPVRDKLAVLAVKGAVHRSSAAGVPPEAVGAERLSRSVEIAREAMASLLVAAQSFAVLTLGALAGLLTLVPRAALLVVPAFAAGLALFAAGLSRSIAAERDAILAEERVARSVGEMALGLRDVVACGGEPVVEAAIDADVEAEARAVTRRARVGSAGAVAVGAGGWLPALLVLAGGPWLRRHGATPGAVLGALAYVLEGLLPALRSLVRNLGETGAWLTVALERIAGGRVPASRAEDEAAGDLEPEGYDIAVRGLTFRYGPRAEPVLSNVDLDVAFGDHLAVLGPSGAGRSTLAALLAGILRPESGAVLLGGMPVAGCDRDVLGRARVLVPQDPYVFAGSLFENLAYLAPGASEADLDEAVDELGARDLVDRLGGYEATVDPVALGGAQRQLLALVRAYVADAPVTLLDEAASHLDPDAEARVEAAFARRGGTLIVVAHRQSSAQRARRILVLDEGSAVAGTHRQLLVRSELYRHLVGWWTEDGSGAPRRRPAARAPVSGAATARDRSPRPDRSTS